LVWIWTFYELGLVGKLVVILDWWWGFDSFDVFSLLAWWWMLWFIRNCSGVRWLDMDDGDEQIVRIYFPCIGYCIDLWLALQLFSVDNHSSIFLENEGIVFKF
jgi:hypothetical protein